MPSHDRVRHTLRRAGYGLAFLAAAGLHILLLMLLLQSMAERRPQIEGRPYREDHVAELVMTPRSRPPVALQMPDMPPPDITLSIPPLPPQLTAPSEAEGTAEVFCFERDAVNGVMLYDCLRLWAPGPTLNLSLGYNAPWVSRDVYDGPIFGPQTIGREEAARRGWVPQRPQILDVTDPNRDKSYRNQSDERFGGPITTE